MLMIEEKTIKLNSWQSKVWMDKTRYITLACGRRAGKTYLSSLKILSFAKDHPKSIIYYVSPTYAQSKSIMWEMLKDHIPAHWIKKANEAELKIEFVNGARVELKGADTEPDRLRGVKIDFLICDEVAYFKNWKVVWNNVLQPTLLDSKGSAYFISSPNGYNHFYDLYNKGMEKNNDQWKSYRFTTYDNEYIDKKEIDRLRNEMDEDVFAQEHLAEFKKYSGMVFKYFSRERHYINPIEFGSNWTFYRGIDFGWNHPSVCLFMAVSEEGKVYIYDMIYQSNLTNPEFALLIKQKSVGRTFSGTWADSANPADIKEINDYGIVVTPVSKSAAKGGLQNEDFVVYKIRKFNQLIKANKFFIFNYLPEMLFEMENYQYKEVKEGGIVKERPVKIKDDGIDAATYVIVNLPEYFEASLVETSESKVEKPNWAENIPSWSALKQNIN